eukprot:XP_015571956.1 uncharacterized protein LOC8264672 [Ricinus communis]
MATNSPNKRLKILTPNSRVKQESDEYDFEGRQGNRLTPMESTGESLICGICLSENWSAMRGQIDSCDHYFCFICIMEWAKIESRCPMCKRRFNNIHRPPKDGVFPSERLVNVPKRDQVYHLFGNTTVEPFDPYAQVQCSICHTAEDESLLLLCDLCDSAAHTYCVGLGFTVPECDWFCHDCAVSRTEHENFQKDEDNITQTLSVKSEVVLAAEPYVAVNSQNTSENYNAGAENGANFCQSDNQSIGRPRARSSQVPSPSERLSNLADDMSQPRETTTRTGPGQETPQSDARTLRRCRDVHSYVRALRENWDALRSGSLRFSSSSVESCSRSIAKCYTPVVTHESSGQSHTMSSTSGQQLTINDGLPGTFAQDRHSHDAKKAWKMMAKAKSIHQGSKNPSTKGNASRKATGSSCSLHMLRSQFGTSGMVNFTVEKQHKRYSPERQTEKHVFSKLKMQNHGINFSKEIVRPGDNLPTTSGFSASITSWKVQTSSQTLENQEPARQQNLRRASSKFTNQQIGSGRLMPLVGPVSGTSKSVNTKADISESFSCKVNVPEGDVRLGKGGTESKPRNDDNAKSEIQSLVKLNMNLLKGVKQLGVDEFKEVARLATYTILAACGFKHSRHVFHSFPRSVCSHCQRIQHLHRSTLMPNSCRECFYVFVKDVVNSVLSEKLSHANSSKHVL